MIIQSNGTTGDTDSLCEEMGGQEKLTEALKAAVSQCVLEGLMTTERAQTYCRSGQGLCVCMCVYACVGYTV